MRTNTAAVATSTTTPRAADSADHRHREPDPDETEHGAHGTSSVRAGRGQAAASRRSAARTFSGSSVGQNGGRDARRKPP
jgi:hypothetical protein